jgi:hypothetical protein
MSRCDDAVRACRKLQSRLCMDLASSLAWSPKAASQPQQFQSSVAGNRSLLRIWAHAAPSSPCLILSEHYNTSFSPSYIHTQSTAILKTPSSPASPSRFSNDTARLNNDDHRQQASGSTVQFYFARFITPTLSRARHFSHLRLPPSLQRRIRRLPLRHTDDFHSTPPAFNRSIPSPATLFQLPQSSTVYTSTVQRSTS